MTEPRNIHIKLTADVSEYLAALEQAKAITEELLALGVSKEDLPRAFASVVQLSPVDRQLLRDATA